MTPTVLQLEAVECGAASLRMILAHYGLFEPLARLREECGVSRDGSKASNICRAARRMGMVAKGYRRDVDALFQMSAPVIIFWNFNHFLVYEGRDERSAVVFLNDPAVGHRTVSLDEFDGSYTGVVLELRPGSDFAPGGREPSALAAILTRLRTSRRALAAAVLAGLMLVIPGLLLPGLTRLYVDEVLVGGRSDWLRPILLALLLTLGVQAVLKWTQLDLLRRLRLRLDIAFTAGFVDHLLRLPMRFYAQRYAGEVAHRIRLNGRVAEVVASQLAATVIDVLMVSVYVGVMAAYDAKLTIITCVVALVDFAALRSLAGRRVEANMRAAQDLGRSAGVLLSGLQSIDNIKASGLEADIFQRWAGHYAGAARASHQLGLSGRRINALARFVGTAAQIAVLVFGAVEVMHGALTLGGLVAFQLLSSSVLGPIQRLVGFGATLQVLVGDLARLDDVTSYPATVLGSEGAQAGFSRLSGALTIHELSFGYSHAVPPIIDGFDLTLQPGQRVALVGSSGSGKSTIGRLLAGLEEPWVGAIRLDGLDRQQLGSYTLAQSVAHVDQECTIFRGSLRDNLTLWDPTIDEASLLRACQDAELTEVIQGLPGGLDGELLEGGVNLSGGQRQRLEIARAIIGDPALLILDEATSALDGVTERLVMRNLERRRCSVVIIAHRLSTIRDCDEILVLDHGSVIERGRHTDLVARSGGHYRELIRREEGLL